MAKPCRKGRFVKSLLLQVKRTSFPTYILAVLLRLSRSVNKIFSSSASFQSWLKRLYLPTRKNCGEVKRLSPRLSNSLEQRCSILVGEISRDSVSLHADCLQGVKRLFLPPVNSSENRFLLPSLSCWETRFCEDDVFATYISLAVPQTIYRDLEWFDFRCYISLLPFSSVCVSCQQESV